MLMEQEDKTGVYATYYYDVGANLDMIHANEAKAMEHAAGSHGFHRVMFLPTGMDFFAAVQRWEDLLSVAAGLEESEPTPKGPIGKVEVTQNEHGMEAKFTFGPEFSEIFEHFKKISGYKFQREGDA